MSSTFLGRGLAALVLIAAGALAGCTTATAPASPATAQAGAPAPAAPAASVPTGPHPGKALYEANCAACHTKPPEGMRAPPLASLQKMTRRNINGALTFGKMRAQGASLSEGERKQLVEYLSDTPTRPDDWVTAMMCAEHNRDYKITATPTVTGFGFDKHNHRRLTAQQAGLSSADMGQLEQAWAVAFPTVGTMRSQAVVAGDILLLPVAETARVFAIDIHGNGPGKPCVKWSYVNSEPMPLRSSAAYGELPGSGRKVIVFGDLTAKLHMLDAVTGELLWKKSIAMTEWSTITGTPVIHNGVVYAPLSQWEMAVAAPMDHVCCKSQGMVVALDATTGETVWKARTMEEARPTQDRGDGKMMWGPSGAPIWSSPAIDEKRGVLYVGTGQGTSAPFTKTTDAILAIDLKTGAIRWSFQATADDLFIPGCTVVREGFNCHKTAKALDHDFGASVVIAKRANGKDILLAGQKSGTLWALDPDQRGKVVWRRVLGAGSDMGGIHWGLTYDGTNVYVPVNKTTPRSDDPPTEHKPGLHAINVTTGKTVWTFRAEPDCPPEREARFPNCKRDYGFSGAPTLIDRSVVVGSMDGYLRVFDARTGKVQYQFDTLREFPSLIPFPATGGSIDNASIVATGGYLFVNSGYINFGGATGNAMLAFKVKR